MVVFAVPTAKTPAFWIAYGFTVVAFAVQPFIWKLALGREKSLKSKFLRFPVIYIAVVYLAIQLITLIVLGSSPTLPIWSSIVACVVVTGVSAICMITADTGRCEIEKVETKAQKKVFYIKEIQAEIELLADAETKVIEVEPQNWRAIFGKGKAAAWQSTLANSRTSELYQAVKKAIEIIDNSGMSEEEVILRKNEFAVAIYNVNNAFLDLRQSNFDKHEERYYDLHWDEWWESHYVQGTENIEQTEDVMTLIKDFSDDTSKRNVLEMKKHICEVLCYICSCSSTCWDSYDKEYLKCYGLTESSKEPFIKKYIGLVEEIQEAEPDFQISNFCLLDPWSPPNEWSSGRYDEVVEYWQKRKTN